MTRTSVLSFIGTVALATTLNSPSGTAAFSIASRKTSRVKSITRRTATQLHSSLSNESNDVLDKITSELKELADCTSLVYNYLSKSEKEVSVTDVVLACDAVDAAAAASSSSSSSDSESAALYLDQYLSLRQRAHEFGRYHLLVKLLKSDYDAYVKTAEFLSPSRIARRDLPNLQDVAMIENVDADDEEVAAALKAKASETVLGEDGQPLVADCTLDNKSYDDSPLDKLLLSIFRNLVTTNTGGVKSDIPGIEGLLAQGRQYMTQELPEGVTYADHTKAQHTMVKNTLGGLMTPVLPPFYRIFMSGIVPKLGTEWDGKQFGPWFYAPYLTSIVTPTFFGFLVGPSYPNRRSDGQRGGLVVEKCKFLQESGCKGLCLHQCKIPAQEFFKEELGLELTVKPNFVTQECQWSFGETPLPPEEDSSFPTGCLVGCESRKAMAGRKGEALCM
eukprot:CAMPEP_0183715398 /NCGR_PEP_ID=MMETSP0737-20130205/9633_1 /TAXON_ID=385413 /ORGANISM="Thalassiosira miniscula, Strain CCMP1093" /LENGTH=446 /DNA_ID=CAMNT_0025944489 /DNA_START=15 /DNA_END=1355 /DNA_ORIENTATION=-